MSDCPNVEMREALPELLHGRLDAAQAAKVREHVALCAECAAELDLLERVRRAYATSPAIDTAAVVRALPAAPRTQSAQRAHRGYSLGVLRLAAAVVFLIAGALVLRSVLGGGAGTVVDTAAVTELPVDTSQVMTLDTSANRTSRTTTPRVLAMTVSEVDDLEIEELESLLGALDRIDAAPVAEPDTLIGSVRGVGSD